MHERIYNKLISLDPWHFIWIAVLASELFTLTLNVILSPHFFDSISADLLIIGAIDAFIVSLVVGSLIIYFVNRVRQDKLVNERLRLEVESRRQAEQKLLEVKNEWEETFNTINDAITIHDRDFNIILCNKAAEDLLGESMDVILSQKCFVSYHGMKCPPDGCPSCLTMEDGKPSTTELFEPQLEKYIEIKAMPRFDEMMNISGVVHVVRDITERKEAEEKLLVANQRTREILDKSPFGIYVVNPKGTIEYINRAMEKISGIDYQKFAEDINVLKLPSYQKVGLSMKISRILEEGKPFFWGPVNYNSHYTDKKTIRNFTGIPIQEGGENKALIFIEDVTEREQGKLDQLNLRRQLIQAQKMESVGRLAGGIAHDFNNILSLIIGYSELLLHKNPDEDCADAEELEIINSSGKKAADLTKQLLAFSRKQVLEMKMTNMNSIVKNFSKMLHRLIGEDIALNVDTATPTGNILADPSQLEQVLMNIAVNARDAMPEGGSFSVNVSEVELDKAYENELIDVHPGPYVLLRMSDSGNGMTPEELDKIFEPFYTTKETGKGTGLGLATVYGIVKQHDGYIFARSEPGKGSTFYVYIPLAGSREESREDKEPYTARKGSETIMVVEDEPSIRMLITSILKPLGYNILDAENGIDALKKSENHQGKIDLLLTDVIMPEMNGRELVERFLMDRPSTKVIYMSGYTDDVIARHGVLEPGVVLIQKPITAGKLVNRIGECLDADRF